MNIIISEILQSDSVHFSVQQYKSYISVSPNLPSRQGRSGHTQLMVTIVEKAIIVRILMAILHFFKRSPLSGVRPRNQSCTYSYYTSCRLQSCIVASCLEPSVNTRERVRRIVVMFELNLFQ